MELAKKLECKWNILILESRKSSKEIMYTMVSGQFSTEINSPLVGIGVWVKVRVSFKVGGQPDNCPQGK